MLPALEGRSAEVRDSLESLVRNGAADADTYHLLARSYQESEPRDLERARRANETALSMEPDNVDFLALKLARRHFHGSTFLPNLQIRRSQDLAERILVLDPDNELAHFVLGEIALDDYLDARESVSFPELDGLDVPAPREAFFNAAYLLNPVLAPDIEAGELDFRTARRYASWRVESVSRDAEADRRYEMALEHLGRAVAINPARKATSTALIKAAVLAGDRAEAERAAAQMVHHLPDDPDAWLYYGLTAYRDNRVSEASSSFDTAVGMLDEGLAAELEDTSRLAGADGPPPGAAFWSGRDPFLLTPENERRLEHLSRMVYADLRFGDLLPGRRGWETEPGDVVVRYGIPLAEAQTSTRFDEYLVLHYGDFFFKFMDLAKSGKLTFYSPKVGSGGPDLDEIERAYDEDYTLISKRIFRELPQRFIFDRNGTRVAVPYLASVLEGANGEVDVYVTLGAAVADGGAAGRIRSGAWLLDAEGGIVVQSDGEPWEGITATHGEELYRVFTHRLTARPGDYTLAVEYELPDRSEAGSHRRVAKIRSVPTDVPAISDLILAYAAGEGTDHGSLIRRGYSAEPAPWGVFRTGQPLYVFFEIYTPETAGGGPRSVAIEAVMTPYEGGEPPAEATEKLYRRGHRTGVSVSYSADVRERVETQYLILDTTQSAAGTYLVGLRLTDRESGLESFAGRAIILE